jgi:hypothetical protein
MAVVVVAVTAMAAATVVQPVISKPTTEQVLGSRGFTRADRSTVGWKGIGPAQALQLAQTALQLAQTALQLAQTCDWFVQQQQMCNVCSSGHPVFGRIDKSESLKRILSIKQVSLKLKVWHHRRLHCDVS